MLLSFWLFFFLFHQQILAPFYVCWWKHLLACVHECVYPCFSHVQLFATLWIVACQAPLSMGLSRQEYWSGLSCLSSGGLPNPRVKPTSLTSPALAGSSPLEPPGKPMCNFSKAKFSCFLSPFSINNVSNEYLKSCLPIFFLSWKFKCLILFNSVNESVISLLHHTTMEERWKSHDQFRTARFHDD